MKKGILIILALVILGGVGAYFYVFHKPHRDPSTEKATYQLSAEALADPFINNQAAANEKYIDKVVEVSGVVLEVEGTRIILDNAVSCTAANEETFAQIAEGDEVKVKGRVIGFDDLFEEVKMDNCIKL